MFSILRHKFSADTLICMVPYIGLLIACKTCSTAWLHDIAWQGIKMGYYLKYFCELLWVQEKLHINDLIPPFSPLVACLSVSTTSALNTYKGSFRVSGKMPSLSDAADVKQLCFESCPKPGDTSAFSYSFCNIHVLGCMWWRKHI